MLDDELSPPVAFCSLRCLHRDAAWNANHYAKRCATCGDVFDADYQPDDAESDSTHCWRCVLDLCNPKTN